MITACNISSWQKQFFDTKNKEAKVDVEHTIKTRDASAATSRCVRDTILPDDIKTAESLMLGNIYFNSIQTATQSRSKAEQTFGWTVEHNQHDRSVILQSLLSRISLKIVNLCQYQKINFILI